AGRTIVTVAAETRAGEAVSTLHDFGAHDIRSDRVGSSATSPPPPSLSAGSTASTAPVASRSTIPKREDMTRKEPLTEREAGATDLHIPVTEEKLVPQKHAEE